MLKIKTKIKIILFSAGRNQRRQSHQSPLSPGRWHCHPVRGDTSRETRRRLFPPCRAGNGEKTAGIGSGAKPAAAGDVCVCVCVTRLLSPAGDNFPDTFCVAGASRGWQVAQVGARSFSCIPKQQFQLGTVRAEGSSWIFGTHSQKFPEIPRLCHPGRFPAPHLEFLGFYSWIIKQEYLPWNSSHPGRVPASNLEFLGFHNDN